MQTTVVCYVNFAIVVRKAKYLSIFHVAFVTLGFYILPNMLKICNFYTLSNLIYATNVMVFGKATNKLIKEACLCRKNLVPYVSGN